MSKPRHGDDPAFVHTGNAVNVQCMNISDATTASVVDVNDAVDDDVAVGQPAPVADDWPTCHQPDLQARELLESAFHQVSHYTLMDFYHLSAFNRCGHLL